MCVNMYIRARMHTHIHMYICKALRASAPEQIHVHNNCCNVLPISEVQRNASKRNVG